MTGTQTYKGLAEESHICRMDLDGNLLEGKKPSTEYRLHLAIYQNRPQTRCVIHAHPPKTTALTLAGLPLIPCLTAEAYLLLGTVAVAPYAAPGSSNLADTVVPYLNQGNLVLMNRHGAAAYGENLEYCLDQLEKAEALAEKTFLLLSAGFKIETRVFTPEERSELDEIRKKMGLPHLPCRCEKKLCPLIPHQKEPNRV